MAKGENIFKRKDGRWEARYIKGREATGKIKYGYCYGRTYREAKEKAEKCKIALASGEEVSKKKSKQCMAEFCDEWLAVCSKKVKQSTYVKYTNTLTRHIKPRLGAYYPLNVNEEVIEHFSNELLYTESLSPKTVKDILVTLRSILKYARKMLGVGMPVPEIVYPKDTKKEMRVLSREEQERLVHFLLKDLDACKLGILLALFTGMRIGELCALKWDNISLKEGIIRITATMQRLRRIEEDGTNKTRIVVDAPKSHNSRRVIPLTAALTELCTQRKPYNNEAYVLTGNASYMEPRTLQYRLQKYADECGLENIHFHALRHTFATRCVEVGFEVKSLSEILGHSTTTITLDRYVHSSIELKRNNMNKLSTIGM